MRSLRLRLTFIFALVTSASIGLLGAFLSYSLSAQLAAQEREQLLGKLELFRHLVSEIRSPRDLLGERHRFIDVLVGHADLKAAVLDQSGAPLLELSVFPWPGDLVARAARGEPADAVVSDSAKQHRVIVAAAPLTEQRQSLLIALAHDTSERRQILARFRATIVLACLLGTLGAGALGYFAAVRGLRPLGAMVRAATRISAERLDERLEVRDVPQELLDLAESFNAMLARLQDAFKRLSEFSYDLAHELRTPLTNLMLHAQVALDKPRSEAQLRGVLESGLEELERLSRTVNDMLFIAKADHAQITVELATVPVHEEVHKIFEYFEALAAERGVKLMLEGSALARADRGMLRRMLANLVSNAVRHAHQRSAVRVRLGSHGQSTTIEVENHGPALSAEESARVFDRFYRAPGTRSGSEGAGLGLAIVRSIVELHGGEVSARSDPPLTTFKVILQGGHLAAR